MTEAFTDEQTIQNFELMVLVHRKMRFAGRDDDAKLLDKVLNRYLQPAQRKILSDRVVGCGAGIGPGIVKAVLEVAAILGRTDA